jgi:hypothetical protein
VSRAAVVSVALVLAASTASAERRHGALASDRCANQHLAQQLQLDLGVAVVGIGMELPVAAHLAVQLEALGFSTFYLPLAGGGVTTNGYGAGVRGTWFAGRDGRGLFVTPFLRLAHVGGEKETGERGHGLATASGITVGQAFRATRNIDLRFGFGAQLVHYDIRTAGGTLRATTPFLAFDLVIGFRR